MMADYAKYQRMLKADLYGGGEDSPPFVGFVGDVTGHISKNQGTGKATVTPFVGFVGNVTGHSQEIDPAEWREAFEERAAIMEHLGGLPKDRAEKEARVICLEEFRRRKR